MREIGKKKGIFDIFLLVFFFWRVGFDEGKKFVQKEIQMIFYFESSESVVSEKMWFLRKMM